MGKQISIVSPDDVKAQSLPDGSAKSWRFVTNKKDGSERMSFQISEMKAGTKYENEVRPDSDGIRYMITGEATVVFEGKAHEFLPGMVLYVPAGKSITWINVKESRVISVYSPPRE